MPTASDLVTDLPADFEVFGQAVDTRLKALNPATTLGDITYASATANTNTRLPIGTNGQVLGVSGGVPTWVSDASGMTNPMTTTGDTIYSSSGSTPARLGIGSTGQVLTVSGGIPSWATPSSGSMTSLATGNLTGTTVTISSISSSYRDLRLVIKNPVPASAYIGMLMRVNSDTGSNYVDQNWTASSTNVSKGSSMYLAAQLPATTNEGVIIVQFFEYAATAQFKLIQSNYSGRSADSTSTVDRTNYRMAWCNNANAISSISLFLGSGDFSSGSYELFGVK